jgi:hypothetical protein
VRLRRVPERLVGGNGVVEGEPVRNELVNRKLVGEGAATSLASDSAGDEGRCALGELASVGA